MDCFAAGKVRQRTESEQHLHVHCAYESCVRLMTGGRIKDLGGADLDSLRLVSSHDNSPSVLVSQIFPTFKIHR